jgi:hypothetical protein
MPGSLVEQLQSDAIQRSIPITDLLRKAKLVAVKLGDLGLSAWADHELDGYYDMRSEQLPQYRQLRGEIKWLNPYRGWQSLGLDVTQPTAHPIGEIIGLLDNESGFVVASVPVEFADSICKELGLRAEVKFHTSCATLGGVIDGARNAVLDWALKLEKAGVRGDGLTFSQHETDRAQTVHINIGSIGNAIGLGAFGNHASITGHQQLSAPQLAAQVSDLVDQVESQLPHSGLPATTIDQARSILVELRATSREPLPHVGRLTAALGSMQRVMEGAAGNLVATGVVSLIAKILAGQ